MSGRRPRLILVLSENWTLVSPRDLRALVRIARDAEDAGVDGVMVSEHVVLGPSAGSNGRPANPREYALPGNQDPATPWPSSTVLLAAIAAATERIRPIAAAIIAPLRHPLLLGFIIAFWSTPRMTVGHLVFAIATTAYILIAIQLEERDMANIHGEAYKEYKQEVSMLIPLPKKSR